MRRLMMLTGWLALLCLGVQRVAAQANELTTCTSLAARWHDEVARGAANHLTVLVFDDTGNLCYANRDHGVAGDPIYVGLVAERALPLRFEPCSIEPEGPQVYVGSGPLNEVREMGVVATAGPKLFTAGPRRCWNQAVDIVFRDAGGGDQVRIRWTLNQQRRYNAALQMGALFSPRHRQTYGLRPDGAAQRIHSQGPSESGPEYFAAVVVYSVLRYLPGLLSSGPDYAGRDIVNDRGALDRVGLVLGVALSNPGRRFMAGLNLELLTGLSVLAAADLAQLNELSGVAEDQPFTGTADQIPTRERWKLGWAFGLTLDLRYVSALFAHK